LQVLLLITVAAWKQFYRFNFSVECCWKNIFYTYTIFFSFLTKKKSIPICESKNQNQNNFSCAGRLIRRWANQKRKQKKKTVSNLQ